MKNLLGVMQGRLVPKYHGRYQAHPVGYWQDEFPIAKSLGLDCIEFILDFNDFSLNPLTSQDGIDSIRQVIDKTGVKVVSICADYFMEQPFHSADARTVSRSQEVLANLLKNAGQIGVKDIVIPCVDQSSLKSEEDKQLFVKNLMPLAQQAETCGINLSLETDLAPGAFKAVIAAFSIKSITVNYDIGNSAALGFNPVEEFQNYGDYITDIHIKDRLPGGNSVVLGTGSADFASVTKLIQDRGYSGPLIMQAYRDDQGTEIFKKQLQWVREKFT